MLAVILLSRKIVLKHGLLRFGCLDSTSLFTLAWWIENLVQIKLTITVTGPRNLHIIPLYTLNILTLFWLHFKLEKAIFNAHDFTIKIFVLVLWCIHFQHSKSTILSLSFTSLFKQNYISNVSWILFVICQNRKITSEII